MGQKTNPIGLRLGIVKDWDSRWFARRNYAELLREDLLIKRYLKKRLYQAGISKITIERKAVRVLPRSAVVEIGNTMCCYLLRDGKAVKTPLQTRSGDANWVEVTAMQVGPDWRELTGDEEVIDGDLTELSDGKAVKVER